MDMLKLIMVARNSLVLRLFLKVIIALVFVRIESVHCQGLQDVQLELRTSNDTTDGYYVVPNHSWLNITEIGDQSVDGDTYLVCSTTIDESVLEWYLPDDTLVSDRGGDSGPDIYSDTTATSVSLSRRNNATSPTGIYHCEISDGNGDIQFLYVGIYTSDGGILTDIKLTYDSLSLILSCITTGGPATNVTWSKNGELLSIDGNLYTQDQVVLDMENAIYETTLILGNEIPGNYSCQVSNLISSQTKNIIIGRSSSSPVATASESDVIYIDLVMPTVPTSSLTFTAEISPTETATVTLLQTTLNLTPTASQTLSSLNFVTPSLVISSTLSTYSFTVPVSSSTVIQLQTTAQPSGKSENGNTLRIIGGVMGGILGAILVCVCVLILMITMALLVRIRKRDKSKLMSRVDYASNNSHRCNSALEMFDLSEISTVQSLSSFKRKDSNIDIPSFENAILKSQFSEHVKRMHTNRDERFEAEYSTLDKLHITLSQKVAKLPYNKLKNRFANTHPYDCSRVVLTENDGGEDSDYINASFVDGYNKPKAYIAAQGPIPNTVKDFWRMICDYKIATIVMLTKCVELSKRKCEQYWPENLNDSLQTTKDISVSLTSSMQLTEYTIRKMRVTNHGHGDGDGTLDLTQFHFTSWPDHGTPNDGIAMLKFVKHIRKLHSYSDPRPLLVHCSAGVGRTGTFIVLDSMLERMKTEDTLNIYTFVKQLRNQRVLMVQTLAQYIFAHDVVAELITCGDTEISAVNIRSAIDRLSRMDDDQKSEFSKQFEILKEVSSSGKFNVASEETLSLNDQLEKSKSSPNEASRVQLKGITDEHMYCIDANYIDGYKKSQVYIATKVPFDADINDFWRMIWEKRSRCIIQLCSFYQESCSQYWPNEEGSSEIYGKLKVSVMAEMFTDTCVTRTMEVTEHPLHAEQKEKSKVLKVYQFLFLVWPKDGPPTTMSAINDLIQNVNRRQMGQGRSPITVMCEDGVDRTGTFICIHAQLERLKTEGVVDIFQFIKGARNQKAGLVPDLTGYTLCHVVVADYLDTFDDYANFKEVM